jgi:ligand-binding sensor domain-containing protein
MMRDIDKYALFLMLVFCTSCGQNQTEGKKIIINSETKGVIAPHGPQWITRNLIQDRTGNIWMATFDGIFRYDGKSFTNITSKVSSARFFSLLEDRKGNLWFGSIDSGVYYYDGKSFTNFTTGDGLLNNVVTSIYEDKAGNIWFGVSGGASCYDGKSFRNYIIDGNDMNEDRTGKTFPNRRPYEVNSIIEDKTGKFWFATRGNTFVYDGKTFTVFSNNGKPFKNVRSIIEDKKGNIWLGGPDGLWRYDSSTFTNFTQNSVGCIYEDRKGNVWTSSQRAGEGKCLLSRYDVKSLTDKNPAVTEIEAKYDGNKGMIFGILEARDGSICLGTMTGVYRYDGKTISDFKGNEVRK